MSLELDAAATVFDFFDDPEADAVSINFAGYRRFDVELCGGVVGHAQQLRPGSGNLKQKVNYFHITHPHSLNTPHDE